MIATVTMCTTLCLHRKLRLNLFVWPVLQQQQMQARQMAQMKAVPPRSQAPSAPPVARSSGSAEMRGTSRPQSSPADDISARSAPGWP